MRVSKCPIVTIGSASPESFFTHEHHAAARMLGHEPIAGVYSRDPTKSRQYGEQIGSTGCGSVSEAVAVADNIHYGLVTLPNAGHYQACKDLLLAGLPVLCEKPFTMTIAEALELEEMATMRRLPFALAYTYQNFWAPTVAARLCAKAADGTPGLLGDVLSFNARYFQDWQIQNLSIAQEWRQDPSISGRFNCAGDILTHIEQLVRVITGEDVTSVLGSVATLGPTVLQADTTKRAAKRTLDDDAIAMLTLENGARGVLHASQVATGRLNHCHFEIWFEKGMVKWNAEDPETLVLDVHGAPKMELTRGQTLLSAEACDQLVDSRGHSYQVPIVGDFGAVTERIKDIVVAPIPPGGHVAGFRTALATMHFRFARIVSEWRDAGKSALPTNYYGLASVSDGVSGMKFVEALHQSVSAPLPFVGT